MVPDNEVIAIRIKTGVVMAVVGCGSGEVFRSGDPLSVEGWPD